MIRFNTIDSDPWVTVATDEMKIIDFLADQGPDARIILKRMDEGLRNPSRPANLIYVDFFFDVHKKVLFLLLVDNNPLKLDFAGIKDAEVKADRLVMISATSSKALIQYFSDCVRRDIGNQAVYYNVQNYLHKQYYRNQIPVE